ncbi:MAG: phage integrase N-terminal SAM-like domain-containing protein [Gemmatimonadaceae bacterium]|jgi:integrase
MSIYRRGAVYWCRFRIPADLILNSASVDPILRISLRTTSRRDALLRVARIRASVLGVAGMVREMANMAGSAGPTEGNQIVAYLRCKEEVARLAEEAIRSLDDERRPSPVYDAHARLFEAQSRLERMAAGANVTPRPALAHPSPPSITNRAPIRTLQVRPVEPSVPQVTSLREPDPVPQPANVVAPASQAIELADGLRAAVAVVPRADVPPTLTVAPTVQTSTNEASSADKVGLSWTEVAELFVSQKKLAAKTIVEYRRSFEMFKAVTPNGPFSEITSDHVEAFLAHVASRPGRKGRVHVSAKTQDKALSALRSLFDWAKEKKFCPRGYDPFIDIGPDRESDDAEEIPRRDLTGEELVRLFDLPLFRGCKSEDRVHQPGFYRCRDHRFWSVPVLLLSGMRLSELKRVKVGEVIRVTDVHTSREFHVFNLLKRRRSERKTKASMRQVPVHPLLLEIGFLEYVARRRHEVGEEGLLFPSYDYSGFVNEHLLVNIGAKDDQCCLYSFRHNYISMLRNALPGGGNDDQRRRLGGHTTGKKDAHLTYGDPLTPGEIALFCDTVRSPFSLAHLVPAAPRSRR